MERDEFLIGRKPILDALKGDTQIEKIWIDVTIRGDFEKELRSSARFRNIPLIAAPKEKLFRLVRHNNHQGVVAQLSVVEYKSLEDVIPFLFENGQLPKVIVLDRIEDVRNLGAIARSAVWFGFQVMVISSKSSARINNIAMKTSAGALTKIHVCRERNLVDAIKFLQSSGLQIIGADSSGKAIKEASLQQPISLVMGSESTGLSREIIDTCNEIVSINGTRNVESLNVSVAAGILMNEIFNT